MAERSITPIEHPFWVRTASQSTLSGLESTVNTILDEECAGGAQLVDIKLTSTPPSGDQWDGSSLAEYAVLIIMRARREAR
jgi:hypothetical protein